MKKIKQTKNNKKNKNNQKQIKPTYNPTPFPFVYDLTKAFTPISAA